MGRIRVWKIIVDTSNVYMHELKLNIQPEGLDDVTRQLPGGAYTTFRTYQGWKVLPLDRQIQRLQETAALLGYKQKIEENVFRKALRKVLGEYDGDSELRFRVSLDLEEQIGTLYVAVEPLRLLPPEDYQKGVKTITCRMQRENPKAKLTNFIARADKIRRKLPLDVNEALMVDADGYILEGLSSNFFAEKDGQLWTEDEHVLSGITRSLVLEIATDNGILIRREPVSLNDIPYLQGAFITSASRGVLPVSSIDGMIIGDSTLGKLTQRLMHLFNKRIASEIEEI